MGITVATTRVALNTSTGTQDITTTDLGGLTPVAAWFVAVKAATDGTAADHAHISIGAATGASNEWLAVGQNEHGQSATDTDVGSYNDRCIGIWNDGVRAFDGYADFDSFITNGVRINVQNAFAAGYFVEVTLFAGTDLSAHADNVALTSVTSPVDVTGPGFEPDVVMGCTIGDRTWNTQGANFQMSVGFAHNDGAGTITERTCGLNNRNGQSTTSPYTFAYNNSFLEFKGFASDTLHNQVNLSSFDASGFTATLSGSRQDDSHFGYLALAFGGAADSWVGDFTTPTSTGNDSETGPGFTPQALVFGLVDGITTINTHNPTDSGTFGTSMIDADDEYSATISTQDGVTTTNDQSLSDNTAIEMPDHGGSALITASFVSFDANGWTLNYSAVDGSNAYYIIVLAIEEEAAGGPITQTVNQASETDTAQAITAAKAAAVGQASETETALSITPVKIVAVGQASETDTPQAITTVKSQAIGQAAETETAQAITPAKAAAVNLGGETDTAQAITAAKAAAVGQPAETDTAQPVTAVKAATLGQPTETETALSITPVKIVSVGQASETDTAQAITTSGAIVGAVGQVSETDTAQAITAAKAAAVGQASETETALSITPVKIVAIGQASETDTPQAVSSTKIVSVGQAVETDTALALAVSAIIQAYVAAVLANPSPAISVKANSSPAVDAQSNPTPAQEVKVG